MKAILTLTTGDKYEIKLDDDTEFGPNSFTGKTVLQMTLSKGNSIFVQGDKVVSIELLPNGY